MTGETASPPQYDYVIVGAGSAGCVLANRLSARGKRVLLLEAGPADRKRSIRVPAAAASLLHTEVDWEYVTEPQSNLGGRRVKVPRGRVLGGSSSINAQVYLRGHRADFEDWARRGNEGWGYDDVLPYFERAERVGAASDRPTNETGLRVTPLRDPNSLSEAFVAASVAAGIRRNDGLNEDLDGVGLVPVTQQRGVRWSTADAYLRPALERSSLEVATDAHATRLLFEEQRAVGVEYRHGGSLVVARAHEVILSGGVVNSPHLLLLSGIGPAAQLRAHGIAVMCDLPGVGQNLQDHADVPLAVALNRHPFQLPESASSALRYALTRRGRLASNRAEAAAFVRTDSQLEAPDLELQLVVPQVLLLHQAPRWVARRLKNVARRGGSRRQSSSILVIGAVVIQPHSVGSIELRSADPLDPVRIDPNYCSDPSDVRTLVSGIRLVRRVLASPPLSDLVGAELLPGCDVQTEDELEAFVRARAGSLQHLVGTCRMGTDELAVVDPELRVHGVGGLRVVDASVMPNVTRGHTNAPTVMIAERAADLILE